MEKRLKRAMFTCGAVALVSAAVITGISLHGGGVQVKEAISDTSFLRDVRQISTVSVNNSDDGSDDIRVNGTKIRKNGETWEYSTDNGRTWTDTPPDGVHMGEDGGLTMWQGQGKAEDFDHDALMGDIDKLLNDILSEANERYGNVLPQGSEDGTSFVYGETIARQVEGAWEFSSDGGETWTKEVPEGFEVSEDGTRFRLGGGDGDGDTNDFDVDTWLDEWYKDWSSGYDGTGYKSTSSTPNIAV